MRKLTLQRTGDMDARGLTILLLRGKGLSLKVVSGAPGAQNFRTASQAKPGRSEPIPEGVYSPLGPIEWAGDVGNYTASFGPGLGPVWQTIEPIRAIGFHLDENATWSPGSSGCVAFANSVDLKTWVDSGRWDELTVDWGLGTITPTTHRHKIYAHSGKLTVYQDGVEVPACALKIDAHDEKIGVVVNGKQVKVISVTTEIVYE